MQRIRFQQRIQTSFLEVAKIFHHRLKHLGQASGKKPVKKSLATILAVALLMQVSFPIISSASGDYSGTVLAESVATAATGTTVPGVPSVPSVITVKYSPGWNMVSVPASADIKTRLYAYDPAIKNYTIVDTPKAGAGYWAYFTEETMITMTTRPERAFTIELDKGWNMVGNPFAGDVALPENYQAFAHNSHLNDYEATDTIPEGYSVWMYAEEPATITLQNEAADPIVEPDTETTNPNTGDTAGTEPGSEQNNTDTTADSNQPTTDTTTDPNQGDTGTIVSTSPSPTTESTTNTDNPKFSNKVVSVKDYGAKGDGQTNDTTAIQNAINAVSTAGGGTVRFPSGTYLALDLRGKSNVLLKGESGAVIKKNGGTASTHALKLVGQETSTKSLLASNASKGSRTVTASSTSGFAVGNYVAVRDNLYVYSTWGRNQEINRIAAINGNTVTLDNALIDNYSTGRSAELVKLSPVVNAKVEGLTFAMAPGMAGGGIYGKYNVGTVIEGNMATYPSQHPGIVFYNSAQIQILNNTVKDGQNVSQSGQGYGIVFNESHNCVMKGNYTENVRENAVSWATKYVLIEGNTFVKGYSDGVNSHGTGNKYIDIVNNTISDSYAYGIAVGWGGHRAGDKNILIKGNKIINAGSKGIAINAPSDKKHQNITVIDNEVTYSALHSGSLGIQGNYTDNLEITNNIVKGKSGASTGVAVSNGKSIIVKGNNISTSKIGISYANAATLLIENNVISNVSSSAITASGTNSDVVIINN